MAHTHTHPFNGPLSGTTRVSRYQKDETNLDFTEARNGEWQWHQLGHMQVCTSLQTDNHTSTHRSVFYRPDALPAAQPTVSKHWRRVSHYGTSIYFYWPLWSTTVFAQDLNSLVIRFQETWVDRFTLGLPPFVCHVKRTFRKKWHRLAKSLKAQCPS